MSVGSFDQEGFLRAIFSSIGTGLVVVSTSSSRSNIGKALELSGNTHAALDEAKQLLQ